MDEWSEGAMGAGGAAGQCDTACVGVCMCVCVCVCVCNRDAIRLPTSSASSLRPLPRTNMANFYHQVFLRPYHFLKVLSFLGTNRIKSASVGQ